ncbi:triose-phosphate isomerase [Aerococcus urinaehominis]|uniref:Triosephosphate isomerase n=1 Tax=Aerococcus urinaehominis TaxID=128944 RepID=A0A0X8FK39_9LACT|nr:triose-phosphate isomerase [Aerococcus urinaehominis]AMB98793.1 triose-phosphate isomerase [Aerococcus urinaehominis]SDM12453.1 triosephosphate isomerase [Aerococcus urinaehominis]
MRKVLIAGNWKMNKTAEEANHFIEQLTKKVQDGVDSEMLVCPPSLFIASMQEVAVGTQIQIGAQNCFYEDSGAYTGEISPAALADMQVPYVIIGHSERRELFGETDEDVNKKAHAIFNHQMIPIICCGETLDQREAGQAETWVSGQIRAALAGLTADQVSQAVIAYEPIWAIGTGKTASAEDAEEMCAKIREVVFEIAGQESADAIRILYGGSVKPANIEELIAKENIDGALVGGASLEVEDYVALLNGGK